jgi:hypothetical protein
MEIFTPISVGEILDKISILEIKREHIKNEVKLNEIEKELTALIKICDVTLQYYKYWVEKLKEANRLVYDDIEKQFEKEKKGEYDHTCVQLSRDVILNNDKRYQIKREINNFYGSEIKEQKSYDNI